MFVTFVNTMSDSLEKLKQHKLNQSSVKKYKCCICKIHGYTRSNDRKGHEEEWFKIPNATH